MSMELILATISPEQLVAVRERPQLLAGIFAGEVFTAGFEALESAAAAMPTRIWFDTVVTGTESLDYDGFPHGPAFALDVPDVRAVAVGLVTDGWERAVTGAEAVAPGQDIDATARSLGAAAGWDPDEFSTYAPMLAATWTTEFTVRLVRAVGAAGGWSDPTTDRVLAEVATAATADRASAQPTDLAAFFAAAAREGKAVVGGLA